MTAKEKPIGSKIPVVATADERPRLAFRDLKDVERPPMKMLVYGIFDQRLKLAFKY